MKLLVVNCAIVATLIVTIDAQFYGGGGGFSPCAFGGCGAGFRRPGRRMGLPPGLSFGGGFPGSSSFSSFPGSSFEGLSSSFSPPPPPSFGGLGAYSHSSPLFAPPPPALRRSSFGGFGPGFGSSGFGSSSFGSSSFGGPSFGSSGLGSGFGSSFAGSSLSPSFSASSLSPSFGPSSLSPSFGPSLGGSSFGGPSFGGSAFGGPSFGSSFGGPGFGQGSFSSSLRTGRFPTQVGLGFDPVPSGSVSSGSSPRSTWTSVIPGYDTAKSYLYRVSASGPTITGPLGGRYSLGYGIRKR